MTRAKRWEINLVLDEIENVAWWVDSRQIQGNLKTKGVLFSTIKIGKLAELLDQARLIRRRRINPAHQKYEYKRLAGVMRSE